MSHRIYYEHARQYDARGIALMAVKTCSKAILARVSGHGKSPCFSLYSVLAVVNVDCGVLNLHGADGGVFLD